MVSDMARHTFTRAERDALTPGTAVEWRNGAHWHPGVVVTSPRSDYVTGGEFAEVRHTGRNTSTVRRGDVITITPASFRFPEV